MVKKKPVFRNIAIFSSLHVKQVSQISQQVEEILNNLSLKILIPKSFSPYPTTFGKIYSDNYVSKNADLIIAIGGDGTLLSAARKFGSDGIPILGINLGKLGFLTDVAPEQLTQSLSEIIFGDFTKEERFLLQATLNKRRKAEFALNEVVIHSQKISRLMEYELYIDEKFVYRQRADGIIISTPTGSTAYSLSGNGPIIHPKVEAINLLPMFPHSLNSRPLIVDQSSLIEVKIVKKESASLSVDGQTNLLIKKGDEIRIVKANHSVTLIHPLDHNFYSACRTKLGWSLGLPLKSITR